MTASGKTAVAKLYRRFETGQITDITGGHRDLMVVDLFLLTVFQHILSDHIVDRFILVHRQIARDRFNFYFAA